VAEVKKINPTIVPVGPEVRRYTPFSFTTPTYRMISQDRSQAAIVVMVGKLT
jgi:hypothetical protein